MCILLTIFLVLFTLPTPAWALLIDDFSDSNPLAPTDGKTCDVFWVTAGQCVSSPRFAGTMNANLDTGLTGVVDGTRAMVVRRTTGRLFADAGVALEGVPGLTYNNDAGVASTLSMTWDGDGSLLNLGRKLGAGAGVDLTANTLPGSPGPATHLRLVLLDIDIPVLVNVTLKDLSGFSATNTVQLDPPPGNVLIPLSLWSSVELDLTHVVAIRLVFAPPHAGAYPVDLTVTCVDTVPGTTPDTLLTCSAP